MADSIIFVDSQTIFKVIQHYIPEQTQIIDISAIFGEGGSAYLSRLYNGGVTSLLQKHNAHIAAHKQTAENCQSVSFMLFPDFVGDALATLLMQLFDTSNDRTQRLRLSSISAGMLNPAGQQKKAARTSKNILETFIALDRVFDAHARQELHVSDPKLPVLSLAAAFALSLVCRLENKIDDKTASARHIAGVFRYKERFFDAELIKINGKPPDVYDRNVAKAVIIDLKEASFSISSIRVSEIVKSPPSLLNMTKLVAAAEQYLGFSAKRTLTTALSLYAGCDIGLKSPAGLITFPVTDSLFLPEAELLLIREYIFVNYGKDYLPEKANTFAEQSRHGIGAIRPTRLSKPPQKVKKYLGKDQLLLYTLIWNRTIASQMIAATFNNQKIFFSGGPKKRYVFRAEANHVVRRGYWQIYPDAKSNSSLPVLDDSDKRARVQTNEFKITQSASVINFSYSEGLLYDAIGDMDISLIETLAYSIEALKKWNFIQIKSGHIVPTQKGRAAQRILSDTCPDILNRAYLRRLKKKVLKPPMRGKIQIDYAAELQKLLDNRAQQLQQNKTLSEQPHICPICNGAMIIKQSETGRILVCENYPDSCQYSKSIDVHIHRYFGRCDLCTGEMTVKVGKFGRFLACSNFPTCRFTKPYPIGVSCPKNGCSGEVIERVTSKGQLFYGCSFYPKCSFSSWQKPVNIACPKCGNAYLVEKSGDNSGLYICPKCKSELEITAVHK